jgi:uncharacterized protein (DUF1697 family)
MTQFVALLRGVNVGKAKRVPMAEWRALLEAQGLTQVQTLLNSGNAVFHSKSRAAAPHARAIAVALATHFGFDVPVVVKTAAKFTAAVAGCPFAASARDPARLLLIFAQERAALGSLASLAALAQPPERFTLGRHAAYLDCANGVLQSKLAKAMLARTDPVLTSRNRATVVKIAAALAGASA